MKVVLCVDSCLLEKEKKKGMLQGLVKYILETMVSVLSAAAGAFTHAGIQHCQCLTEVKER